MLMIILSGVSAFLMALVYQTESKTVLFVCEHGAAKSVVAAAHFNHLAAERGLPFRAVARGTSADPSLPAAIVKGLKAEGLSVPAGFTPSAVTGIDLRDATHIVAFDVTLPSEAQRRPISRWDHLPAFSDGYAAASAAIQAKVRSLLQSFEAAIKKT